MLPDINQKAFVYPGAEVSLMQDVKFGCILTNNCVVPIQGFILKTVLQGRAKFEKFCQSSDS